MNFHMRPSGPVNFLERHYNEYRLYAKGFKNLNSELLSSIGTKIGIYITDRFSRHRTLLRYYQFEDRKGTFSPSQIVKPRTNSALFISSSCKSLFGSFHAQTRVPDFCRPQRNSICEQPKHSKYIDVSPRNSSHEDIMNISAGDLTSGRVKYIFTLAYRS